jgi:hypothetical protein
MHYALALQVPRQRLSPARLLFAAAISGWRRRIGVPFAAACVALFEGRADAEFLCK